MSPDEAVGEVGRKGSFFRWNINPSYCVFRAPHVILFDEAQGLAEVRDIVTGRMCEVIEEKGLRPIRLARRDQDLQCLSSKGLMQIKEVRGLTSEGTRADILDV